MGLLFNILTFPVSAPLKGAFWAIERVAEAAEAEYYSEDAIQAQLLELSLAYESGALTEDELAAAEDALLDRLEEARRRRTDEA